MLLAASSFSTAQQMTSSTQIPGLRPYNVDLEYMSRQEKDSVRMVSELWKAYVESFTSSSADDARRRSFWVDGSPDYLQEFDDGNLLYASFRENRILDIRKLGDGVTNWSPRHSAGFPAMNMKTGWRRSSVSARRPWPQETMAVPIRSGSPTGLTRRCVPLKRLILRDLNIIALPDAKSPDGLPADCQPF